MPLLSMVLKEGALLTSCFVSWKETFFLPDLPMIPKEVSLPLFLTVSLTLLAVSFSLLTLMLSTPRVLKAVLCIFGWGLERSLSAHLSDDFYDS